MNEILNLALEQAKQAKVQIYPGSASKQPVLFDDGLSSNIRFNGFASVSDYQHHLIAFMPNASNRQALICLRTVTTWTIIKGFLTF